MSLTKDTAAHSQQISHGGAGGHTHTLPADYASYGWGVHWPYQDEFYRRYGEQYYDAEKESLKRRVKDLEKEIKVLRPDPWEKCYSKICEVLLEFGFTRSDALGWQRTFPDGKKETVGITLRSADK